MGQTLARFENHVRIDKAVKDSWGIPVLHISAAYGDNEYKLRQDAQDSAAELYGAAGFKLIVKNPARREPGQSIHEVGTCRMGDNPQTSILNKWNQSHDVKNLFVVDGGAFVSGGWQNPA
jgi:choline dehydrogenase-like flavoprotein